MLQELPPDVLASVLEEVGPPWPTIGASHAESKPSGVAALRSTSRSMMRLVDNCHGYWAASNLSRYGCMKDTQEVPYHAWLENHRISNQCVCPPDTHLVKGIHYLDRTSSHCLILKKVGPACSYGHRATITAVATGRKLIWHCHGFCFSPDRHRRQHVGSVRPHPFDQPVIQISDEYYQGHTGAVTALLPVPPTGNDNTGVATDCHWPGGWVSAALDRTVKLWDVVPNPMLTSRLFYEDVDACLLLEWPPVVTTCPLRTLRLHDEGVTCMTLVPVAGQVKLLLATGSADRTIALSTLHPLVPTPATSASSNTSPKVATLRGHEKTVTCLACIAAPDNSPSPCSLVSGGLDGRVKLWDVSRATGSGTGACKRGWKLGFPCLQLLSFSQLTTDYPGLADQSPSCVNQPSAQPSLEAHSSHTAVSDCMAVILSAGLQILDVRQDAPALYISHGRLGTTSANAYTQPTAAVHGNNLALCHDKQVAVYDIRMLTSSRPAGGAGANITHHRQISKPRLVLTTQPSRQLCHVSIDRFKVVAAAAPGSSKKSQQGKQESSLKNKANHTGPIFCWDVDTGQLLNDFTPVPVPDSSSAGSPSDSPAGASQKQAVFRPQCWPPRLDLLRAQINFTGPTQPTAGGLFTSQPGRQTADTSTGGSGEPDSSNDEDSGDDNSGSSWYETDSSSDVDHHKDDVPHVDIYGMAVHGSTITCVARTKKDPDGFLSFMDFNAGFEIARKRQLARVDERLQQGGERRQTASSAGRFWA